MTGLAMEPLTIGNPAYFDRLAELDALHWWSAGMWRIADSWLERAIGGRHQLLALDVGCGTGGTLARLAGRREIEGVVGIDPSEAASSHAGRTSTVLGSALALPFATNSFDVVTCFDVFQHLRSASDIDAAAEMRRVLRPRRRRHGSGQRSGAVAGPRSVRQALPARPVDRGHAEDRVSGPMPRRMPTACRRSFPKSLNAGDRDGTCERHHSGIRAAVACGFGRGKARNRVMGAITAAEAFVVGRLGVRLPVGHSTLILAENTAGQADRRVGE